MWAQVDFVLSQSTRLTDIQTDGQKDLGNTVHWITCSHSVKTVVVSALNEFHTRQADKNIAI